MPYTFYDSINPAGFSSTGKLVLQAGLAALRQWGGGGEHHCLLSSSLLHISLKLVDSSSLNGKFIARMYCTIKQTFSSSIFLHSFLKGTVSRDGYFWKVQTL
jgi:hypothetical protein